MKPVGFDNTMLSILLNPNGRLPIDPATRQPVDLAKRRAEFLVEILVKDRRKIIIPTPAQAELLTAIGPTAQQYFDIIGRYRSFEVAAFDSRCAIELACLNRDVFSISDPKSPSEAYQKVKFDRQIIAILKVAGVEQFYTDDTGMAKRARLCGLVPIATHELAVPADDLQGKLPFEPPEPIPDIPDEPEE